MNTQLGPTLQQAHPAIPSQLGGLPIGNIGSVMRFPAGCLALNTISSTKRRLSHLQAVPYVSEGHGKVAHPGNNLRFWSSFDSSIEVLARTAFCEDA
jgi:hypothetical protein